MCPADARRREELAVLLADARRREESAVCPADARRREERRGRNMPGKRAGATELTGAHGPVLYQGQ